MRVSTSLFIAKVERNGKFAMAIDGRVARKEYDGLWDPVVGPSGDRVLVKALEGGKVHRRVVKIEDL